MQYDAIKEIVKVPFYTLKQIWSTTEFILENYKIQRLICGNICVPDVDIAFTVFFQKWKPKMHLPAIW